MPAVVAAAADGGCGHTSACAELRPHRRRAKGSPHVRVTRLPKRAAPPETFPAGERCKREVP